MKTTILTIILIILACCSFKLGVSSEKKKCDIVIQVNGTIFTIPHGKLNVSFITPRKEVSP